MSSGSRVPITTTTVAAPAHDERASIKDIEVAGADVDDTREPSVKLQWGQPVEIDDAYLRASAFTKFWRSVLFQMILFGA